MKFLTWYIKTFYLQTALLLLMGGISLYFYSEMKLTAFWFLIPLGVLIFGQYRYYQKNKQYFDDRNELGI